MIQVIQMRNNLSFVYSVSPNFFRGTSEHIFLHILPFVTYTNALTLFMAH